MSGAVINNPDGTIHSLLLSDTLYIAFNAQGMNDFLSVSEGHHITQESL